MGATWRKVLVFMTYYMFYRQDNKITLDADEKMDL